MIKHNFSLLCSRTSVDENTKSLSIFDVIEQILVCAEPTEIVRIPLNFEIISHWRRTDINIPAKGLVRVYLKDPKGITKRKLEMNIELTDAPFFRSIIRVSGIELRGPGEYNFIVDLQQDDGKWKEVTSIPFNVNYEKSPNNEVETLSESF
ncbi:MAG: hypothetical protein NTZ74_02250 [Chloroflexi bacterium]|nr:hypothetical protein [Chloroflexota bacterium]